MAGYGDVTLSNIMKHGRILLSAAWKLSLRWVKLISIKAFSDSLLGMN